MKILLINPNYTEKLKYGRERYYIRSGSRWTHEDVKLRWARPHYLPFPFSLAYSAALLKNKGFDVQAIDAVALNIREAELLMMVKEINPDLVFFEVTFPTADRDIIFSRALKDSGLAFLAVGGYHITACSEELTKNGLAADIFLKGDYEFKLCECAELIRDNKYNGGKFISNVSNVVDSSLDSLPMPLRDIFPSNNFSYPDIYWDGFCQFRPAIQMQSSRGCFFQCSFCLPGQLGSRGVKFRTFSVTRIVDEIKLVKNRYKAREIYFDDDDFCADRKRTISICEALNDAGLDIKWSCMCNIINLDDAIIEQMANSGCIGIKFGIESGSKRILQGMDKPVDFKKTEDIIRTCRLHRIKTHATFAVGFLNEGKEDIDETVSLAKKMDFDSMQLSTLVAFPGTEFYNDKESLGLPPGSSEPSLGNLTAIRKRMVLMILFSKIFSILWWRRHMYVVFRTLSGVGLSYSFSQITGIIIDESARKIS